ncbi:ATP-binding protein [Mycetocola spongiae]|uniref:ATP-binding protein n=1 Tax=Mycetocola spongiae TaxID=2859226 RepID=UPI001CF438EB|nr:ATP-binding protein [Mycetocola spongiae]UCR89405.1 DUF4118 domain-containing protein [Mycetocola spongiae]
MPEHVARGDLKVYLGFAPGVGKTFAMLEEAQELRQRGVDVVVALVEDHGRARTRDLVRGLEVIARRDVAYRGSSFSEMDLDAVLRRNPAVAIVDELAHSLTRAEGDTRGHEKRWEDVHALLDAGINVISTVNIQHLESLNDVVSAITGIRQRETIPDRVLREAAEVELVDLTPDALRTRLGGGEVYHPDKVDAALANYFRVGNLTALRELALLWLADQVEEGLSRYRSLKKIDRSWPARERVVVAVTGGPESETLIRRGMRIVGRSAGRELLAVHVIQDDGLRSGDPGELAAQRELVESLGGSWHTVIGDDPAAALLEFARGVNASQLVLGVSRSGWGARLLGPGIGTRVINGAGDIDVHMVTHSATRARRSAPRRAASLTLARRVAGWVAAVLGPALVTGLFLWIGPGTSLSLNLLVYTTLVVFVALLGGFWPAVATAVLGTLLLNFFFAQPIGTFTIHQAENVVALVLFLVVAAGVARVVDLAARRTTEAAAARAQAALLSELAGGVLREGASVPALLDRLRETFGQESTTLVERPVAEGGPDTWRVLASSGPACADPRTAANTLLLDERHALLLRGRAFSAPDQRILEAYAGRILGVLAQQSLEASRIEARELTAGNAIRTALLAAVSHDLRTPLAGIKAAASSLRLTDVVFSPEDEAELLATIEDSADVLNALVTNLLDMSRIQAGAVRVERAPLELGDLIAGTLAGIRRDRPLPEISTSLPEDPPAVLGDYGLIVRILANLVDNAISHGGGAPIGITPVALGERVEIRISDRGPGVKNTQRDRIFQPFQRLGDTPEGNGVGLGLAVARGLAEGIGGTLEAEDTPGGGLTMVLTLPAVTA